MAEFDPLKAPETAIIRAAEEPVLNWDFTNWLDEGETITSFDSITVTPGGALAFSGLGESGQRCSAKAASGAAGITYVCLAKITSSNGQKLHLSSEVEVRT